MTRTDRRSFILGLCGTGLVAMSGVRIALAAGKISPDDKSVLIVVDVQNCFLPGGSLAVTNGDQVIPVINRIAKGFSNVVLTQDWHTPGHISFASAHSGAKPFDRSSFLTGIRCCGLTIVFKGQVRPTFRRKFRFRKPSLL